MVAAMHALMILGGSNVFCDHVLASVAQLRSIQDLAGIRELIVASDNAGCYPGGFTAPRWRPCGYELLSFFHNEAARNDKSPLDGNFPDCSSCRNW
jgi:hypothetical protein